MLNLLFTLLPLNGIRPPINYINQLIIPLAIVTTNSITLALPIITNATVKATINIDDTFNLMYIRFID